MDVIKGNFVRVDCELKVSGGDVIESSKKSGPIEYKHGDGRMLAALESQLEGMKVGDEKSGVISAKDAFGTEESQPTMSIPKKEFPKDAKLEKGARFEAKGPTGTPLTLDVVEIDDEKITARVVHPLAGKDIEYTVKVLSVRPPPPPVPVPDAPESIKDADLEVVEAKDDEPKPKEA